MPLYYLGHPMPYPIYLITQKQITLKLFKRIDIAHVYYCITYIMFAYHRYDIKFFFKKIKLSNLGKMTTNKKKDGGQRILFYLGLNVYFFLVLKIGNKRYKQ